MSKGGLKIQVAPDETPVPLSENGIDSDEIKSRAVNRSISSSDQPPLRPSLKPLPLLSSRSKDFLPFACSSR
jgi:hypothetical protein